jgi:hypothetical protein
MPTDVERMRYYERQFLGATDFDLQQTYHRDSLRRHLIGPHTWGIATGLELTSDSSPAGGLDVTIEGGLAVDAFARTIVLLDRVPLSKAPFDLLPFQPTPQWIVVALRYTEETTGQPTPGFEPCAAGGDEYRIRETYTVELEIEQNPVTVEGTPVDPTTIVADGSVPYQALPEDDATRWTIALGRVQWQSSADPTVSGAFLDVDTSGRVYCGVVTSSVLAPAGQVIVRDRLASPPSLAPDGLLVVEGALSATGLVTAASGLDVDGAVQVQLDPTSQLVIGTVDTANPSGPLDAQVTITDEGDITAAGKVAVGVATPGTNRLAVGAPGASAETQFTIADSGQTQVGGPLTVKGLLEINSSLAIHDTSGGDDSVSLIVSRSQRASGQDDLRVQIGDNIDGSGRLVVGALSAVDGTFKEQFVVDNFGNVRTAGSLSVSGSGTVSGSLTVDGSLTVTGASNLLVVHVEEFSMHNGPSGSLSSQNTPFDWACNHPGKFASIYTAFVVWNGFSLFDNTNPGAWAAPSSWGHVKSTGAIPQHAFIRVTGGDTESTSGVGYVAEAEVTQEGDNSILFTVVVLGRGL